MGVQTRHGRKEGRKEERKPNRLRGTREMTSRRFFHVPTPPGKKHAASKTLAAAAAAGARHYSISDDVRNGCQVPEVSEERSNIKAVHRKSAGSTLD
jgi:hypothetical protein